jgi:hypothetical protein
MNLQVPPLSLWWKRFKPNQSTLPAAALASAFCCASLLFIWVPEHSTAKSMERYGHALARTLAHSNAGLLLHQDRIELAVIANHVVRYDEVAGIVFYGINNEIIALSGSIDNAPHYPADATLDDSATGSVGVVLNPTAFAPPMPLGSWLLTMLVLTVAPFLSLGLLQLSARGNRSLPIVSVPEPKKELQKSYCLTINLHNQLALAKDQRIVAVNDALNMAQEVCAMHQGIAVEVAERGVVMLFDQHVVNAGHAISASFLMQRLLADFETDGSFRCYLNQTECPGSPTDMDIMSLEVLQNQTDIDELMTLAALAKAHTVLLSEAVYSALSELEKTWARVFSHPLLEDVNDAAHTYSVAELPAQQAQLVESQAMLILGFTQASAS